MQDEKAKNSPSLKTPPQYFATKNVKMRNKLKIFVNFVIPMVRLSFKQ
jgi:hypothetical protein